VDSSSDVISFKITERVPVSYFLKEEASDQIYYETRTFAPNGNGPKNFFNLPHHIEYLDIYIEY